MVCEEGDAAESSRGPVAMLPQGTHVNVAIHCTAAAAPSNTWLCLSPCPKLAPYWPQLQQPSPHLCLPSLPEPHHSSC